MANPLRDVRSLINHWPVYPALLICQEQNSITTIAFRRLGATCQSSDADDLKRQFSLGFNNYLRPTLRRNS
jgi:hypothetical protein